jgi:hypothetical protein
VAAAQMLLLELDLGNYKLEWCFLALYLRLKSMLPPGLLCVMDCLLL